MSVYSSNQGRERITWRALVSLLRIWSLENHWVDWWEEKIAYSYMLPMTSRFWTINLSRGFLLLIAVDRKANLRDLLYSYISRCLYIITEGILSYFTKSQKHIVSDNLKVMICDVRLVI